MNVDRIRAQIDLEHSLHELTTTELLYFMAKIIEELTRRHKEQ